MTAGSPDVSPVSEAPAPIEHQGFDLRLSETDGLLTATLFGELDMVTAPDFAERLRGLCDDGARHVVLDLAELSFIDSSGLSALVSTLKCYRAAGGEVILRSPTRATAKVLEICGLTQIFTIEGCTGT